MGRLTLPLTPEALRAAYDYLAATPPFNRWNLPDGDDVRFVVARTRTHFGWRDKKRGKQPVIVISRGLVGHSLTLLMTMAHEMVHQHVDANGMGRGGEHNAAFQRFAARVCRVHGFDPKVF